MIKLIITLVSHGDGSCRVAKLKELFANARKVQSCPILPHFYRPLEQLRDRTLRTNHQHCYQPVFWAHTERTSHYYIGALCVMVRTIHMLDWYRSYLFLTMIRYIRHKAKQAHSNSSISCSISHEPKQACHKCHIPCCISWKVKQVLCKSIIYLVLATQCSIFPDRRS